MTALAAPVAQRQNNSPSMEQSIQDMTQGAANFPTLLMSGNSQGAASALAQLLTGAASFPGGFFADMAKGGSPPSNVPRPPYQAEGWY
jgi:hypothetical protein